MAVLAKFLVTLIGGGSPALRREARWRACRVALERFMRWDGPVLAGFLRHAADFGGRGIANGCPATTVLGPPGRGALCLSRDTRRRRPVSEGRERGA